MKKKNNLYHIVIVFGSVLPEDNKLHYINRSKEIINSFGMQVEDEKKTGLIKFAYPINKLQEGFYYILSISFKNMNISIKKEILHLIQEEIKKICGNDILRYQCFSDNTLSKLFTNSPNV